MTSNKLVEVQSINLLEEPTTIPLTDRLAARLYSDCRPHCLETACLQKGLVLILDGDELIEEGVGFGVPVVKYGDKTYFSSSAKVSLENNSNSFTINKIYTMDTISRKRIWRTPKYIDDDLYSTWRELFAKFYLKHKQFTHFFNQLMELREVAKIKTEFIKAPSRGAVAVQYQCQADAIKVIADFSDLRLYDCQELLVLNEQGSNFFTQYVDTDGTRLIGGKIGAWDQVMAQRATLLNSKLTFSLNQTYGATLFRGWERTRKRFSWVGLSYSLHPNDGTFRYTINLDLNKTSCKRQEPDS